MAGTDATTKEILVCTPFDDIAEYQGTRTALEAEGVIPAGTKWPNGYDDLCWEDGKYRYWLSRRRPDGAKGPRKLFIDVDWWRLRFDPLHAESFVARKLKRKTKELADFVYDLSDKGRAESYKDWITYCETTKDEKFQAFKALVPGLIQPKRGRKHKDTKETKSESQH